MLGNYNESNHDSSRIVSSDGIAPTVKENHGTVTAIVESFIVASRGRNPQNPSDRTVGIHTEQRLEMNMDGLTNTITSVQKDNLVMETIKIKNNTNKGFSECEIGGVFDASYPDSETRRGRVQENGNVCPTLTADSQELYTVNNESHTQEISIQELPVVNKYRIRKLTPRECGRLMGVSDEDITKMLEVNSKSQCYKQFGNSIVVDVMMEMFKQLF